MNYRIYSHITNGRAHAYLEHQDQNGEWWGVTEAPAGEMPAAVQEFLDACSSGLTTEQIRSVGATLLEWHESAYIYARHHQEYDGSLEDFIGLSPAVRQEYEDSYWYTNPLDNQHPI